MDSVYFLQLRITTQEIDELNLHLKELQNILNFTSDSSSMNNETTSKSTVNGHEEGVPDQTIRFCRNLDSIERTILQLTGQLTMHDPTRKPESGNRIWNQIVASLPSNLHQLSLYSVVAVIVFLIIFWIFPYISSRQRMVIFTIIFLVLGLSMLQFYFKQKREFQLARAKRLNIKLESFVDCGFKTKMCCFIRIDGYQC